MKWLGRFGFAHLFIIGIGLNGVCQTQQNASCQPQDYTNLGAEIANTAVKIEGTANDSGLSQDAIQSIIAGYTAKRVQLAATNCNASASTTTQATSQPVTPVATNTSAPSQPATTAAASKTKTKGTTQTAKTAVQAKTATPAASSAQNTAKCPGAPVFPAEPTPSLGAIGAANNVIVQGTVQNAAPGSQVQVCVNGQPAGGPAKLDSAGKFTAALGDLTAGEIVTAQLVNPVTTNASPTFGPVSSGVIVGDSAKCPLQPTNSTEDPPTLNKIDVGDAISGSLSIKGSGSVGVLVCVNGKPQGSISNIAFTTSSAGSAFTLLAASPALVAGDNVVVQLVHPAGGHAPVSYSPPSAVVMVGSCSGDGPKSAGTGATFSLTPPIKFGSNAAISGKVSNLPNGSQIRVCVNDLQVGTLQTPDSSGAFTVSDPKLALKPGDTITAQSVSGASQNFSYGPPSAEVSAGPCSAVGSADSGAPPTLDKVTDGDMTIKGKLAKAASGTVRICENDSEIATAHAAADGTFSATLPVAVTQGQSVTAQQIAAPGAFPKSYGLVSAPPTEVAASLGGPDNVPVGLNLKEGNTLFTRSAVALQIASASGAPVNANYALGFFLNAPLYWHDEYRRDNYWRDVDCADPKIADKHPDYCPKVIPTECAQPFKTAVTTCSNSSSDECKQNAQQVASCVPKIQDNEQQRRLRRQFRDPLEAPLWAYGLATLSSIPQTGITVGSLTSPTAVVTNAVTSNSTKDITTIVQKFNVEQGLEWKLYGNPPVMPDAFGSIPQSGSSFTKLGLFAYGGYGLGVPVNGILNPTTYYDLNANPNLYAQYNLPSNIPGTPGYDPSCGLTSSGKKPPPNPNCGVPGANPYKYLALQQVSSLQFFQSYYFGLRLKSFTYDTRPCKNQPAGAGNGSVHLRFCSVPRSVFPGLYDVGIGQDQAVTGYRFHGPVLRLQGSYSLPFYTPLHVFGVINYALHSGPAPAVTNFLVAPDTNIPTSTQFTYLQPVPPPTHSLYSFGVSLDVVEVVKSILQAKIQIAAISPTISTYSVGKLPNDAKTIQFYAPVSGTTDMKVIWQVCGPDGSCASAGSISESGVYTPPAQVTSNRVVTVTATAHADTTKSSTLQITLTP